MSKQDEIDAFISKAEKCLQSSRLLIDAKDYDAAISRSYYGMFYLIEALLFQKGKTFSRHSAVISAFAKEFILTEIIDSKFHRYIIDAFDQRMIGDYDAVSHLDKLDAEKVLENAEELLQESQKLLKNRDSN